MKIIDEIRNDAVDFASWAAKRNYTRARVEDETTDYLDYMFDDGLIAVPVTSFGWTDACTFLCQGVQPTDDMIVYDVEFTFSHLNGTVSTNTIANYDRAMKGI